MNQSDQFEGWDWNDPDDLDVRFEHFTANIASFDALEEVAQTTPRDRAGLKAAGISGIEFAAFATEHPEGLGTDLVSLRTKQPGGATADGVTAGGAAAGGVRTYGDDLRLAESGVCAGAEQRCVDPP